MAYPVLLSLTDVINVMLSSVPTNPYFWNKVLLKTTNSVLLNGMWQVNSQQGKNAR